MNSPTIEEPVDIEDHERVRTPLFPASKHQALNVRSEPSGLPAFLVTQDAGTVHEKRFIKIYNRDNTSQKIDLNALYLAVEAVS